MYFIQFAKTEQVSRRNKETPGYISQLPPFPHLFNPFLLVCPLVSLPRGQEKTPVSKKGKTNSKPLWKKKIERQTHKSNKIQVRASECVQCKPKVKKKTPT